MYETARFAIGVMAYPALSLRHGESVCIAGLRTDSALTTSWIRLFPIDVRDLPSDLRLHKWAEVEADVVKTKDDHRPESFTPDRDSLNMVGELGRSADWAPRRSVVDRIEHFETMGEVEARQEESRLSLAAVRTGEVLDLTVSHRSQSELADFEGRAALLASRVDLFATEPRQPLEPVPFDFHFVVKYPDEREPRRLKLIDWEINQTWRKWRHAYLDAPERIREKWLEMCSPDRDTLFFVGNQKRFPSQFLLLNVFYPPARI